MLTIAYVNDYTCVTLKATTLLLLCRQEEAIYIVDKSYTTPAFAFLSDKASIEDSRTKKKYSKNVNRSFNYNSGEESRTPSPPLNKSSKHTISIRTELEQLRKKYEKQDKSIATIRESTLLGKKNAGSHTLLQNVRSTSTDTIENVS